MFDKGCGGENGWEVFEEEERVLYERCWFGGGCWMLRDESGGSDRSLEIVRFLYITKQVQSINRKS